MLLSIQRLLQAIFSIHKNQSDSKIHCHTSLIISYTFTGLIEKYLSQNIE